MQNTNPPLGPNRREWSSITSSTSISSRMSEKDRQGPEYKSVHLKTVILSKLVLINNYIKTHTYEIISVHGYSL